MSFLRALGRTAVNSRFYSTSATMTKIDQSLLDEVKSIIPPLSSKLHKGQAGRVGVMGGSRDYTGAPYYSSFSAMRLGADLAHVICESAPGNVIKGYSPDLIVHGLLDKPESSDRRRAVEAEIDGLLERLHAIVIGPGLGRDQHMQDWAEYTIGKAREKNAFVVVDADGLWLIQNKPDVIRGYRRAVLTPNPVEFGRLLTKEGIDPKSSKSDSDLAQRLAKSLGGVTILQKGATDLISNGDEVIRGEVEGGLKRCGGQGDVLSGTLGTFLGWGKAHVEEGVGAEGSSKVPVERVPLIAAYGASCITRTCSHWAFAEQGRAMQTSDMLPMVGKAYEKFFGDGKRPSNL